MSNLILVRYTGLKELVELYALPHFQQLGSQYTTTIFSWHVTFKHYHIRLYRVHISNCRNPTTIWLHSHEFKEEYFIKLNMFASLKITNCGHCGIWN